MRKIDRMMRALNALFIMAAALGATSGAKSLDLEQKDGWLFNPSVPMVFAISQDQTLSFGFSCGKDFYRTIDVGDDKMKKPKTIPCLRQYSYLVCGEKRISFLYCMDDKFAWAEAWQPIDGDFTSIDASHYRDIDEEIINLLLATTTSCFVSVGNRLFELPFGHPSLLEKYRNACFANGRWIKHDQK